MHHYRTEVANLSTRPPKIVWFEGYHEADGTWYPGNVLGRTSRGQVFSAHGSDAPDPMRVKWAFIAVDESGHDDHVEAEVEPSVVRVVDHAVTAAPAADHAGR